MSVGRKKVIHVTLLCFMSVALAACGGLSAENARERLLTSDDFDFEVKTDSAPSELTGASGDELFEGDCDELDKVRSGFRRAITVAASDYEDRSDAQNGFLLREHVLQFQSTDEARGFIADVKRAVNSSDCEWSYSNSSRGSLGSAFGYGSEDFGNVRDLDSAFKIGAEDSVVWDVESSLIVSGTFLSTSSQKEGGTALASAGNLIVLIDYWVQADEVDESSSPVTRTDLEKIVAKAFKKMLQ